MTFQLRDYQRAAIDSIYGYYAKHSGHALIVIPTAGGKSLVMAAFMQEALTRWPDQRFVVVTHVRELISQNFAELMRLWPEAPAGIYSAGLNRRDANARILFAGIQSAHRKAGIIRHADLVLVDEAHLIPARADTTYRRFLDGMLAINPKLKIIGFTATPYRLDSGMLHKGPDALFDDIAFEVSVRELIEQGYLSPLISKRTGTTLDVSGVGTRGGEFIAGQLEAAVDQDPIIRSAIDEVITYGRDRRSWLLFCAGVDHARHVCDAVRERGITCATIFGETPKQERDAIIASFKRGEIRALASMGVLTTGFNAPAVDLIAMLRPTKSTGLYVQMAGRGTRLAPGKENCLVLDFAGNVARHGPIDAVRIKEKGEGDGIVPTKDCPECDTINALSARECIGCGHEFPEPEKRLDRVASTLPILSSNSHRSGPISPKWVRVSGVTYHRHDKPGKPPSLRVDYHCGLLRHQEWVCLEHRGYPGRKAVDWWYRRTRNGRPPATVDEALARRRAAHPDRDRGVAERPVHGDRACEVPMTCAICRRQARGFGWFDARAKIADPRRDQSHRWLCSLACQNICHRRRGMIDPTRDERAAMEHAVAMAGEYVESLGRTDLMTWSRDELMTLIEVIVTAFTDRLRELADRPPEVPYP